jgi:hypothetical protein
MFVKIAKLGSKVVELYVEDGTTLAQALEVAEMSAEGFEPRVNGAIARETTVLTDGAIITMVPKIKGGHNS